MGNNMPVDYNKVLNNLKKELLPQIKQIVDEAEEEARTLCPVDTGSLRSTIRSSVIEDEASFSVTLEAGGQDLVDLRGKDYSQYVEYGVGPHERTSSLGNTFTHPGQDAQPFIRPAGYNMEQKLQELAD